MSLKEHSLFLMIILMSLHDNLSSLGADKLLYFSIACLSSSLENGYQDHSSLVNISSNRLVLTCQLWVELNDLCKVSHKSSSLMQGWPLKWTASIAGSFLFLTQFINSQGPHFLSAISSIFPSKNLHFALLMIFLNFFQSSIHQDCLYTSRSVWHLWSYQALDRLVILVTLEYLYQILLILYVIFCSTASKSSMHKRRLYWYLW